MKKSVPVFSHTRNLIISLSCISAVLIFVISCQPTVNPKPIANFSIEAVTGKAGAYKLTNKSQHADRYQWNFGDGQTSTEENPTVQYRTNGIYNIQLTAKNEVGSDDAANSINVDGVNVAGSVMFWTNARGDSTDIEVYVDNVLQGAITSFLPTGTPGGCGTDGYVTFYRSQGTYSFYAKSRRRSWSGTVTITNGVCNFKLLPR
ncbi:PKD domain-containing protein [Larkinella terrae]|uniref:PKD domain-containing protein n=1 Tax=Larkinella terrae TaxID=2025311 RepID=A0A7K0EK99_9BACT|nr:PKD domain-containing protein [Larkinella terrae]MRS62205.1 PKD domain-containing protein [Larkinella terrae]